MRGRFGFKQLTQGWSYPKKRSGGGETYCKRNESSIVTGCLQYLQILENSKQIAWYDRCNSGMVKSSTRRIKLHRAGTPDLFFICTNGIIVWVEVKFGANKLRGKQINFKEMINKLPPYHQHWTISEVGDFQDRVQSLTV
jgi:hypothetical protein